MIAKSNASKHQPRDSPLPFDMRIIHWIVDIMTDTIFITIEHIICTASNVDGIDKAVFSKGISKIPKGFLVASCNVIELVVNAAYGSAFNLSMQEETAWNRAVTDKDELAEE